MVELTPELQKAHELLKRVGDYAPDDDALSPDEIRRRAYRAWSEQFPIPDEAVITEEPGLPGLVVRMPESAPDRALVYHHGGSYRVGGSYNHREMGAWLAAAAHAVVYLPDYPLAPEHPFPAAVDGAVAAYRHVRESLPADRIVVGGDSAGGGLSLALILRLAQLGEPLPAAVVPNSPWTDLTVSAPSYTEVADRDPFVSQEMLLDDARNYLGDADPKEPLASPLFGDLSVLPPVHIEVGDAEVMIDDSRRLAERARAAGVPVELVVVSGAPHIWQHFASFLPQARDSIARIGAFVRDHTA